MGALGFDTSNYTASVAWTDGKNDINVRRLLQVKQGERGIRQSEGLFQHVKLVPELFAKLAAQVDIKNVRAVGVSTRPRNVEGSYMPVFLAGSGYAKTVSEALGVKLYEFSHQDGHIMAGIYSSESFELLEGEFLSVHLSGGTTEILKSRYCGNNFINEIVGGTRDISAGQLIDRIGVKLGMKFPAGREMEELSKTADKAQKLPVYHDGAYMSFSGTETKAIRMLGEADGARLALGTLTCVRDTLAGAINCAICEHNLHRVLIVGGVASNALIREGLINSLDADVYFAKSEYSTDNAVGAAYLAHMACEEA